MWEEAGIISLLLLSYGFWRHRKWLKEYFKNWWMQYKIVWFKGDKEKIRAFEEALRWRKK